MRKYYLRPNRDEKLELLDEIGTKLELLSVKFSKQLGKDEVEHLTNMQKSFDVLYKNALDEK